MQATVCAAPPFTKLVPGAAVIDTLVRFQQFQEEFFLWPQKVVCEAKFSTTEQPLCWNSKPHFLAFCCPCLPALLSAYSKLSAMVRNAALSPERVKWLLLPRSSSVCWHLLVLLFLAVALMLRLSVETFSQWKWKFRFSSVSKSAAEWSIRQQGLLICS